MKFDFSFQKILDFKEKEKELAQQEYGETKQRERLLQDQLNGLEQTKENVFKQYNHVDRKTVWEILEVQEEINHVNEHMEKLTLQKVALSQEMEQKQQALLEKTQEAKVWNKWKEKSKLAFQKQLEQKEQAIMDEMAVLRHSRKI